MTESKVFQSYMKSTAEGNYDFYRCWKCQAIITREEELLSFKNAEHDAEEKAHMCSCRSRKYYPDWPHRAPFKLRYLLAPGAYLEKNEWLHGNVLRYTCKLVLARGLAPWLDRNFRIALPVVEKLVRYKEA